MTTLSAIANSPAVAAGVPFVGAPYGCASQYMESASIFNSNPMAFMGYGYGCGMGVTNPDYYNAMGNASDNMTSLSFKFRSNQHVLGSYNEIMQKNMTELAAALRSGQMGKASKIYDEVYQAISQNYGQEITTQADRVAFDQSIKATISTVYQQVNGYPLTNDINENGEGYFENGFMQGLTFGNHHRNSAEETESYMTGTAIEGYSAKSFSKSVGKLAGYTTSIGGCALAGAAIGSFVPGVGTAIGAAVGAGIGAVITLGNWIFSGNEPTKVTEAY